MEAKRVGVGVGVEVTWVVTMYLALVYLHYHSRWFFSDIEGRRGGVVIQTVMAYICLWIHGSLSDNSISVLGYVVREHAGLVGGLVRLAQESEGQGDAPPPLVRQGGDKLNNLLSSAIFGPLTGDIPPPLRTPPLLQCPNGQVPFEPR